MKKAFQDRDSIRTAKIIETSSSAVKQKAFGFKVGTVEFQQSRNKNSSTIDQDETQEVTTEQPCSEINVFKFNFSAAEHPVLKTKKREPFEIPKFQLDSLSEEVIQQNTQNDDISQRGPKSRVQPQFDNNFASQNEFNLDNEIHLHHLQKTLIDQHNQQMIIDDDGDAQENFKQIRRNICFVNGKVVLAYQSYLVQFDLLDCQMENEDDNQAQKSQYNSKIPKQQNWMDKLFEDTDRNEQRGPENNEKVISKAFSNDQIKVISILNNYKFVSFIDTGSQGTAMIIENQNTKQVRFILVTYNPNFQTKDEELLENARKTRNKKLERALTQQIDDQNLDQNKDSLVFEQLGLVQRMEDSVTASIVKVCQVQSYIKTDSDDLDDESSRKYFNVCLILRSNGNVQVFSDFEYTHTIDAMDENQVDQKEPIKEKQDSKKKASKEVTPKPQMFCVDIESDSEFFFLKYMKLDRQNVQKSCKNDMRPYLVIRKVSNQWRSCIKYNQSKEETSRDWDSCKLKQLSGYMRLYSTWLVFQGHFLIAHRGYISVFNLNSEEKSQQENDEQDDSNDQKASNIVRIDTSTQQMTTNTKALYVEKNWVQHVRVDEFSNDSIRDMFLEKSLKKKDKRDMKMLKYHSQPLYSLYKRFIVNVVIGGNKIVLFRFQHGMLTVEKKLYTCNRAMIAKVYPDKENRTGSFYTLTSEHQLYKVFDENQTDHNLSTYEEIQSQQPQNKDMHLVYTNVIENEKEKAKHFCVVHKNYQKSLRIQQWCTDDAVKDEGDKIGRNQVQIGIQHSTTSPQIALQKNLSVQTADNERQSQLLSPMGSSTQPVQVQQQLKLDTIKMTPDVHLQIISTDKSFWKDQYDQLEAVGKATRIDADFRKMIINDQVYEKKTIKAMVIYKKNSYLKLIPFIKSLKSYKKNNNDEKQNDSDLIKYEPILGAYQVDKYQDNYILEQSAEVTLIDEDTCADSLKDEEMKMFQLVGDKKTVRDIEQGSFVVVTNTHIHVFDQKKNEIHRFSGFDVKTAIVIDSCYMYIMEEFCDQVYSQHADPENDNQISEEKRRQPSKYVQESGFTSVNFNALFFGQFIEVEVTSAACGLNSYIGKSMTTDDISVMKSLEEMSILPIPHWNLMSFVGMGSKNQYLIWKNSIDGFFTALSKKGKLITWSSVTGKLLWQEPQEDDCNESNLKNYRVYRSDKDDFTYLCNEHNYNDSSDPSKSCKISLLVSKFPVNWLQSQSEFDTRRKELEDFKNNQVDPDMTVDMQIRNCLDIQKEITYQRTKYNKEDEKRKSANYDDELLGLPGSDQNLFIEEMDQMSHEKAKKIRFIKASRRMKLYHFKVLKLRQYEDVKRDDEMKFRNNPLQNPHKKRSECKMLFHFFHKLLHPYKQKNHTNPNQCDWFLSNDNIKQRLYLSTGAKKMLEVIQNRIANLMERDLHDIYGEEKKDEGQLVRWKLQHTLPNFPFFAFELSSLPYFISDDFEHYCEFDYDKRQMHVVKMYDQYGLGKIVGTLPSEAIATYEHNLEKEMIKEAFACISVQGNDSVITLNKESGLMTKWHIITKEADKLTEEEKQLIDETNETIRKTNRREVENLKVIMSNNPNALEEVTDDKFIKILKPKPLEKKTLDTKNGTSILSKFGKLSPEFSGRHYFKSTDWTFEQHLFVWRIFLRMDKYQKRMSTRAIQKDEGQYEYYEIDKYRSDKRRQDLMVETKRREVLKELQEIDYSQSWVRPKSSFQIERAFTWIDWKKANLIYQEKEWNYDELLHDEKLRLLVSVFPGGLTLLKMLSFPQLIQIEGESQTLFKEDSASDCKNMFESAESGLDFFHEGEWHKVCIEVPLITDCYGMQPLDYALGIVQKRDICYLEKPPGLADKIRQSENLELVQNILDKTKHYSLFTNTLNMVYPIIHAVDRKLPEAFEYLNARLIKTQHISNSINFEISSKHRSFIPQLGLYGVNAIDDLTNTKEAQAIFKEPNNDPEKPDKKQIYEYYWFDIPLIFEKTKEGNSLMNALLKNKNVSIYTNPGIQLIVQNQHEQWYIWNMLLIKIPISLQLVAFTIKSSFLDTNINSANYEFRLTMEIISCVIAIYFLLTELYTTLVAYCRGFITSQEIYNQIGFIILSLISPILILFTQFLGMFFIYEDNENGDKVMKSYRSYTIYWNLTAWTVFFLWLKFINTMSSISFMSAAISMVKISFVKMQPYLIMMFSGVACFTGAFQAIQQILFVKSIYFSEEGEEIEPPFDKNPPYYSEFTTTWYEKWIGEYDTLFKQQIIGSVAGFDGEGTDLYDNAQWLLYLVCIVFNLIVLMNLLLALVGTVHGEIHELQDEYRYQQFVYQIVQLQRITRPIYFLFDSSKNTQSLMFVAKERRVDNDTAIETPKNTQDDVDEENNQALNKEMETIKSTLETLTDRIEKIGDSINNLKLNRRDDPYGPTARIVKRKPEGKSRRP